MIPYWQIVYVVVSYIIGFIVLRRSTAHDIAIGRPFDSFERVFTGIALLLSPIWAWVTGIYWFFKGLGSLTNI